MVNGVEHGMGGGVAYWHPAPVRPVLTHEEFCHAVRRIAVARVQDEVTANLLLGAKLTYGVGTGAYRGVCHYQAWHAMGQSTAMIEIAATGEESAIQLAGTTIHETAHVLAGPQAGHDKEWKDACYRLGLGSDWAGGKLAMAAGQTYAPQCFAPDILPSIIALGEPSDGLPQFGGRGSWLPVPGGHGRLHGGAGACPMGRGVRGGKSIGPGSGRLRLWECPGDETHKPVKVRVASDEFKATCDRCGQPFEFKGA
jgi:hypothetical protein